MATDNQNNDSSVSADIDTRVGVERSGTAEVGADGNVSTKSGEHSGSVEVGGQKVLDEANIGAGGTKTEGDQQQQTAEKPDGETGDKSQDKDDDALPDFNADDPAVLEAYDKRFTKADDGGLNLEAFSAEWWANAGGDLTKGSLSDGTYKYLESQFGLTREQVKGFEEGEIAKLRVRHSDLQSYAGGPDAYSAAVKWGREGGYSEEQRNAFNAAINGPDPGRAREAVELLMARFEKANKSTVVPGRTAANGTGSGDGGRAGGDVFRTKDEWLAARKEAGSDMAKQQAVQDKFMRSPAAAKW